MKTTEFLRRLGALLLALLILMPDFALAAQGDDTVYIRSEEDLRELQRNCSYDAWSVGKTVVLQSNISLGNVSFSPIPFFAGTFDGGGHTISGLLITGSYAPAGLFGEIAQGGVVKNLNVNGSILPSGEKASAGGIAGKNGGTIVNCSFLGTVKADNTLGAIAGENTGTGTIENCSAAGAVYGTGMTGGIAGCNLGVIKGCGNTCNVNTTTEDPSVELSDLDMDSYKDLLSLADLDTYNISTDTGGIAGYNSGYLLSCSNEGSVGYEHIGYNVGGVAGRSCGFISGCINNGEIYGRKEVGGIVGLAEPYVVRSVSSTGISDLKTELHKLSSLLDGTITDAENSSLAISGDLSELGKQVAQAETGANELAQNAISYADSLTGEINRFGQVAGNTADQLTQVTETLPEVSEDLAEAAASARKAVIQAEKAGDAGMTAVTNLQEAADDLQAAVDLIGRAKDTIEDDIDELKAAAEKDPTDTAAFKAALSEIEGGISALTDGDSKSGGKGVSSLLSDAEKKLQDALEAAEKAAGALDGVADPTEEALALLQSSGREMTEALKALDVLADYLAGLDPLSFEKPSAYLSSSTESLYSGMQSISEGLATLNASLTNGSETLLEDFRIINDQISVVSDLLLGELSSLQTAESSDILSDTSEEDINAATLGKLLLCENTGAVSGDLDVGGVAGAMSVYNEIDPEGDFTNGSTISNQRYELKCILQSCESGGSVTAKKNSAGGICGCSKLGLILSCSANGGVKSKSGSYVGGICGSCGSVVRGCSAKTSLSGSTYVGGIFGGDADDALLTDILVEDCIAMVEISDASQYTGAVAGNSKGTLKGNLFVSDSLAGCNGLSREGGCEPISYEKLMTTENLPAMFSSMTVRFVAGEEVLSTVSVDYGQSVDKDAFPDIPSVEGCYGSWDTDALENIKFDRTVTLVYETYITALESQVRRDAKHPVFFVAGNFDNEARLESEQVKSDFSEKPDSLKALFQSYNRQILEQWQLSFPDDGSESHNVRYMLPNTETHHILVYLKTAKGWQELNYDTVGSYLCFELPSSQATITVVSSVTAWWVWAVLGAILAAILGLIFVTMLRTHLQIIRAIRTKSPDKKAVIRQAHKTRLKIIVPLVGLFVLLGLTTAGILIFAPQVKKAEQNGENFYTVIEELEETVETMEINGD